VEVFVLKKQLTIFMVILVAAVSWAAAESGYPPILISTYGIPTNSKLNSCTTCHSSVPARNAYGIQLENAGSNSDLLAAFAATRQRNLARRPQRFCARGTNLLGTHQSAVQLT
jgi:hypothetical protein